eukprot:Nitzschia sp. Nitz4//scaffold22_size323478//316910//317281//NITZ4_000597-RA/size323478-processed-gene-0.431-mRNA-1//1//CDS//3329543207//3134//frame0
MGEEDPKKPEDMFRAGIKQFVSTTNDILGSLEEVTKPIGSSWEYVKEQSSVVTDAAVTGYQRRHEFPLEIIGASAALGGGTMWLRNGRISGVLGAAVFGGAAYAVVYDEIKLEELPDMVFGKK